MNTRVCIEASLTKPECPAPGCDWTFVTESGEQVVIPQHYYLHHGPDGAGGYEVHFEANPDWLMVTTCRAVLDAVHLHAYRQLIGTVDHRGVSDRTEFKWAADLVLLVDHRKQGLAELP